jgi:peptidylprolyl isomerase
MKSIVLVLCLAAAVAANAQTTAKSANTQAKPAAATHPAATVSAVKLPPGVHPVPGIPKTLFALRYQEIKIGTGAEAEPNKLYKVHYTGWLASGGYKFDSSYDHPRPPALDKDGKPVLGADGKPKQGDPQPITFPQGYGRVIPGWDQGFGGMKIGGKRRIFIPWQLAYGAKGRPGPDPAHPGIPPKADLIFDVELVDVADMPAPPTRPGMPGGMSHPMPGTAPLAHPQPNIPAPPPPTNPDAPKNPAPPANPASPTTPNPSPNPTTPPATQPTAPTAPSQQK